MAIVVQFCLILYLTFVAVMRPVSLEFLSGFSLINTIIVMVIVFKIGKQLFTISSMFILFLAVFHFGQAWLYALGAEVDTAISYDIFDIYTKKNIYNTLLFSLLAYNMLAFFWLFFVPKDKKIKRQGWTLNDNRMDVGRRVIFWFGILLFAVLLIPVLVYDYKLITITAQSGHKGLYESAGELSVWAAANSYFPLAIIMVLLGCDPKKKWWRWMYFYAVGRCLLLMILTGKRGSFVIPLLLYVFCKHHFIKPYKKRQFAWIAVAGLVLLSMISFISYGRGDYSDLDFMEFVREKNIFVQILSELGGSFTTTVLSYNYTLKNGFLEGKSYIGALSVFLPLSDTLVPHLKEFMSVSELLNPYSPSGGALGGSFFGEMYINFGFYSLFLTPFFAWLICRIEKIINNANKYNLFAVCSSVYISYGFWIYVRGNLVDVVFIAKRTLYVLILYLLFRTLFVRKVESHERTTVDRI